MDAAEHIARAQPEYLQDARDILFSLASKSRIAETVDAWLRFQSIAAYHATRLTPAEVESVRTEGLKLLRLEDRAGRFAEMLGDHSNWPEMQRALPSLLREYGVDGVLHGHGQREATVHVCISKSGLLSLHYFEARKSISTSCASFFLMRVWNA